MSEQDTNMMQEPAPVEVDVEQIMREIREQVRREYHEPVAGFDEALSARAGADTELPEHIASAGGGVFRQLANEARAIRDHQYVPYFRDMGSGPKSLVKRVIRRLGKCVGLPMSEEQNEFNLHVANGIECANTIAGYQQEEISGIRNALDELDDELTRLSTLVEEQDRRRDEQDRRLEEQSRRLEEQDRRIEQCNKSLDTLSMSFARTLSRHLPSTPQESLRQVEDTTGEQATAASEAMVPTEQVESLSFDYFDFQNEHRGTQTSIMDNQRLYLPYFKDRGGEVLDLGCGRGEFLRLLKEEGIPAFGVDMNPEYEIMGELYDIDIRIADGIALLEQVDEKLGGIFCAQVVEHIGFEAIERLCRLAYERLERGAYLVIETPNPQCLSIYSNAFYLDPTHDKPVHPYLLEYLLKTIGFGDVEILLPDHSQMPLPHIESTEIANLDEVNHAIDMVSQLLYGSQDYAIVAKR